MCLYFVVCDVCVIFVFVQQKTAYEMRISDWSSDVCSSDLVEILSGVYEGVTTGTPIALLIRNTDARSKDYAAITQQFRPGHADYTYWHKYGIRDPRGGGRSSARETTVRVAAAVIAKNWLAQQYGIQVDRKSTRLNSSH